MSRDEEYRNNAAKCLQLADQTLDQAIRLGLIDMAHCWLNLAEQAEQNHRADAAYAAPATPVQAAETSPAR